ncbi:biotin--[acetyl-CoA-carboxylase] ligase [Dichotomicrobium thermohalophilum]|uniref:biotin--[biotin carboxyl-carrier protein] ligase n=1 Tax=Dichotomicrobium thermohalophilum TaxID=933063 RepID=A0A397QCY7_9HYPH|nr:biotin--[acetyl-CoA-carboxylase] ligase [Dichotomicrobium thermohalophilum]RIA56121.1 BirA family biotin operon repressor/biotin-[acetyl-CoA-carboxylase] ligase [Dichotomicrobium thermohalophilum]
MSTGRAFITLPGGHRALFLSETASTNAEAMALALEGAEPPLWVWAARQTKGRGRLGRDWDSPEGNLYASLLLRLNCPAHAIGGLPLIAGLAARDAVSSAAESVAGRLRLKWPNDIMLDGAKLGGVLIESLVLSGGGRAVVIGTGLNLASAPSGLNRAVTSLREHGCTIAPEQALTVLAEASARWLAIWDDGAGFGQIREAWLSHAVPLGAPISVTLGGEKIAGRFGGLDETGALRLRKNGAERIITAGDVAIGWAAPVGKKEATGHE